MGTAIQAQPRIFINLNPGLSADSVEITPGNAFFQICTGSPIRLSSNINDPSLSYSWQNSLNVVLANTPIFEGLINEGRYRLEIRDINNALTSSIEFEICVDQSFPANVTFSTNGLISVCTSGTPDSSTVRIRADADFFPSGLLSVCQEPSNLGTYIWYKDSFNNPVGTDQVLEVPNNSSSAGVYLLEVSNACGATNISTFELNGVSAPPPSVRIIPGDPIVAVCPDDILELRAEVSGSSNGIFFQWINVFTNEVVDTGAVFRVDDSAARQQFRVQAINGCGSVFSEPVFVSQINPSELSVFTSLSTVSVNEACEGDTVRISTIISPPSPINSTDLIKDGEVVASFTGVFPPLSIPVTESGVYAIRINRCDESFQSPSGKLNFIKTPTELEIRPEGPPALAPTCDPPIKAVKLRASSDGTDLNYRWERSTDNITFDSLGFNSPSLEVTSPGFYRVRAINGCLAYGQPVNDFELDRLYGDIETLGLLSSSIEITEVSTFPLSSSSIMALSDPINCSNTAVTLETEDAGAGAFYEWFNNGAPFDTTLTPHLEVNIGGNFQVRAQNACGISDTSSLIQVNIGLPPSNLLIQTNNSISANSPFLVCDPSASTLLSARVDGPDINYEWFNSRGSSLSNQAEILVSESGTFTLLVSNPCGTIEQSVEVQIQSPPPTSLPIVVADPCQTTGQLRLLTDSTITNPTFTWFRNGIPVDTTSEPFLDITQTGFYRVLARNVCDTNGVGSGLLPVVSIDGLPMPTIVSEPINGIDRICPGEEVILKANIQATGEDFQFRWFKGFELIEGENDSTLVVTERGEYRVEVFSEDNSNCTGISLPYNVFVRPTPTVLIAFDGSLSFCKGESLELRAGAGVPPTAFLWFQEDSLISETSSVVATEGGTYSIVAIYDTSISNFPCPVNVSRSVEIEVIEVLRPKIAIEGNVLRSLDSSANYQWNVDGIPILGATNPTYLPLDSGFYSLTVVNEVGCSGISETLFHPGTFLERDDLFRVAPNPNNGTFTVVVLSDSVSRLQVYNALGELISEEREIPKANSIAGFGEIQINNLSPGIYLLRAFIDDRFVTRKVIVL